MDALQTCFDPQMRLERGTNWMEFVSHTLLLSGTAPQQTMTCNCAHTSLAFVAHGIGTLCYLRHEAVLSYRTTDGAGDDVANPDQMMCEATNLVFSPFRLGHKKCPKGLSKEGCAHLPDCSFSKGAFSACCDWPVFDSDDLPDDHFRQAFTALRTYDSGQCPKVCSDFVQRPFRYGEVCISTLLLAIRWFPSKCAFRPRYHKTGDFRMILLSKRLP